SGDLSRPFVHRTYRPVIFVLDHGLTVPQPNPNRPGHKNHKRQHDAGYNPADVQPHGVLPDPKYTLQDTTDRAKEFSRAGAHINRRSFMGCLAAGSGTARAVAWRMRTSRRWRPFAGSASSAGAVTARPTPCPMVRAGGSASL